MSSSSSSNSNFLVEDVDTGDEATYGMDDSSASYYEEEVTIASSSNDGAELYEDETVDTSIPSVSAHTNNTANQNFDYNQNSIWNSVAVGGGVETAPEYYHEEEEDANQLQQQAQQETIFDDAATVSSVPSVSAHTNNTKFDYNQHSIWNAVGAGSTTETPDYYKEEEQQQQDVFRGGDVFEDEGVVLVDHNPTATAYDDPFAMLASETATTTTTMPMLPNNDVDGSALLGQPKQEKRASKKVKDTKIETLTYTDGDEEVDADWIIQAAATAAAADQTAAAEMDTFMETFDDETVVEYGEVVKNKRPSLSNTLTKQMSERKKNKKEKKMNEPPPQQQQKDEKMTSITYIDGDGAEDDDDNGNNNAAADKTAAADMETFMETFDDETVVEYEVMKNKRPSLSSSLTKQMSERKKNKKENKKNESPQKDEKMSSITYLDGDEDDDWKDRELINYVDDKSSNTVDGFDDEHNHDGGETRKKSSSLRLLGSLNRGGSSQRMEDVNTNNKEEGTTTTTAAAAAVASAAALDENGNSLPHPDTMSLPSSNERNNKARNSTNEEINGLLFDDGNSLPHADTMKTTTKSTSAAAVAATAATTFGNSPCLDPDVADLLGDNGNSLPHPDTMVQQAPSISSSNNKRNSTNEEMNGLLFDDGNSLPHPDTLKTTTQSTTVAAAAAIAAAAIGNEHCPDPDETDLLGANGNSLPHPDTMVQQSSSISSSNNKRNSKKEEMNGLLFDDGNSLPHPDTLKTTNKSTSAAAVVAAAADFGNIPCPDPDTADLLGENGNSLPHPDTMALQSPNERNNNARNSTNEEINGLLFDNGNSLPHPDTLKPTTKSTSAAATAAIGNGPCLDPDVADLLGDNGNSLPHPDTMVQQSSSISSSNNKRNSTKEEMNGLLFDNGNSLPHPDTLKTTKKSTSAAAVANDFGNGPCPDPDVADLLGENGNSLPHPDTMVLQSSAISSSNNKRKSKTEEMNGLLFDNGNSLPHPDTLKTTTKSTSTVVAAAAAAAVANIGNGPCPDPNIADLLGDNGNSLPHPDTMAVQSSSNNTRNSKKDEMHGLLFDDGNSLPHPDTMKRFSAQSKQSAAATVAAIGNGPCSDPDTADLLGDNGNSLPHPDTMDKKKNKDEKMTSITYLDGDEDDNENDVNGNGDGDCDDESVDGFDDEQHGDAGTAKNGSKEKEKKKNSASNSRGSLLSRLTRGPSQRVDDDISIAGKDSNSNNNNKEEGGDGGILVATGVVGVGAAGVGAAAAAAASSTSAFDENNEDTTTNGLLYDKCGALRRFTTSTKKASVGANAATLDGGGGGTLGLDDNGNSLPHPDSMARFSSQANATAVAGTMMIIDSDDDDEYNNNRSNEDLLADLEAATNGGVTDESDDDGDDFDSDEDSDSNYDDNGVSMRSQDRLDDNGNSLPHPDTMMHNRRSTTSRWSNMKRSVVSTFSKNKNRSSSSSATNNSNSSQFDEFENDDDGIDFEGNSVPSSASAASAVTMADTAILVQLDANGTALPPPASLFSAATHNDGTRSLSATGGDAAVLPFDDEYGSNSEVIALSNTVPTPVTRQRRWQSLGRSVLTTLGAGTTNHRQSSLHSNADTPSEEEGLQLNREVNAFLEDSFLDEEEGTRSGSNSLYPTANSISMNNNTNSNNIILPMAYEVVDFGGTDNTGGIQNDETSGLTSFSNNENNNRESSGHRDGFLLTDGGGKFTWRCYCWMFAIFLLFLGTLIPLIYFVKENRAEKEFNNNMNNNNDPSDAPSDAPTYYPTTWVPTTNDNNIFATPPPSIDCVDEIVLINGNGDVIVDTLNDSIGDDNDNYDSPASLCYKPTDNIQIRYTYCNPTDIGDWIGLFPSRSLFNDQLWKSFIFGKILDCGGDGDGEGEDDGGTPVSGLQSRPCEESDLNILRSNRTTTSPPITDVGEYRFFLVKNTPQPYEYVAYTSSFRIVGEGQSCDSNNIFDNTNNDVTNEEEEDPASSDDFGDTLGDILGDITGNEELGDQVGEQIGDLIDNVNDIFNGPNDDGDNIIGGNPPRDTVTDVPTATFAPTTTFYPTPIGTDEESGIVV